MRLQPSRLRRLSLLLIAFCLLLLTLPAAAQDDPPAPQFLYRDENKLVLVDGYTGDTRELPFDVTEQDRFEWSPDGQYLLAWLWDRDYGYCLNLYDVNAAAWVYDDPISCAVQDALFSVDGTRIVYTSSDHINTILWLYSLADESSQELYRTTDGYDEIFPADISDIQWSPTQTYLTFVSYISIFGGPANMFLVMNVQSGHNFTVKGVDQYYASYNPIWSDDDGWFLIVLQEEYVTSGTLPHTNHRGDVYLVNSETGQQYRLTYTPAVGENNVRWTEDGMIAFDVVVVEMQEFTFTPEQAMNVEAVPDDEIVWPQEIDPEDHFPDPLANVVVSPDTSIGAWVSSESIQSGGYTRELNIGNILSPTGTAIFSAPLPELYYQYSNILIGWRPSDYPYPLG